MTADPGDVYETCELCDGHGYIDGHSCVECNGQGIVPHECAEPYDPATW